MVSGLFLSLLIHTLTDLEFHEFFRTQKKIIKIIDVYIGTTKYTSNKCQLQTKFYVSDSRLFQTFLDFLSNWWKSFFRFIRNYQRSLIHDYHYFGLQPILESVRKIIIKEESGSVFYWFSVFWASLILKSNCNSLKEHISQIYHSSK